MAVKSSCWWSSHTCTATLCRFPWSLIPAALLLPSQPLSSVGSAAATGYVGCGRLETRSSSCLKCTRSTLPGGAPNHHHRSSSVTRSSRNADNVSPSQAHSPQAPCLSPPFNPSTPDHNRLGNHHGKLAASQTTPFVTSNRLANNDFLLVDVDRNGLRSRQLHLLPRRPKLPSRIRRQGSRERRHINRNPLQRWRCPGG